VGIAVCVAAMVILLSAFNGIEHMVSKLYTSFDAPITIQHQSRKTFFLSQLDLKKLAKIEGLTFLSKEREELVVVRKKQRWVNATLHAVDPVFFRKANVAKHLINGVGSSELLRPSSIFLGADLFSKLKLGLGSDQNDVLIYAPKQKLRMRLGSNPFQTKQFFVEGALNYNQELNGTVLLCNFAAVADLFNQKGALTSVNIYVSTNANLSKVQSEIQNVVGKHFKVQTQFQKNELIYKTSQSERLVVFIILLFVFVLASFNLIATLTMLIHEKQESLQILKAMGMGAESRFLVFFFEGQLLVYLGVLLGLFLGLLLCWSQQFFSWLIVPGANVPFPIIYKLNDFLSIFLATSVLGFIFTYFPVRFLLRNK